MTAQELLCNHKVTGRSHGLMLVRALPEIVGSGHGVLDVGQREVSVISTH